MIIKIDLNTIPFKNTRQSLDALKTFNYLFGSNGSGKTTISNIISDPDMYPDCCITWANRIPLETRVYNRDFIDRNLQNKLEGVFTLGEMEASTLEKIESTKEDIKKLAEDSMSLTTTLQGSDGNGGKEAELENLKTTYKDKFWLQKQKHAEKLGGGLTGYLGDSEKFKNMVLSEADNNKETLLPLAELEEKAATIFSKTLASATRITEINISSILTHEKNPILQKLIIGKEDVDIAAMIKKLGNSDWVRQGLTYYKDNEGICPFCQQKTNKDFEKSLIEYFDESFSQDSAAVNKLASDYATDALRLQQKIQGLIDMQSEFLDTEKLKSEKQVLDSIITINSQRLIQKQKEASQAISLDSFEDVLRQIDSAGCAGRRDRFHP